MKILDNKTSLKVYCGSPESSVHKP